MNLFRKKDTVNFDTQRSSIYISGNENISPRGESKPRGSFITNGSYKNSIQSIKSKRSIIKSNRSISKSKYLSSLYLLISRKPKDILRVKLKQKIPIADQVIFMVKEIVEEIFETAFEKGETREYLRKAPKSINNILCSFLDLSISMALINVENEDLPGNVFGENSGPEPSPCEPDNWIRNHIRIKKVENRKRLDSDSTISKQIMIFGGGDKKTVNSGSNNVRRSVKSYKNKKKKNLLPEPVEIDNYVEEDYISKERTHTFLTFFF